MNAVSRADASRRPAHTGLAWLALFLLAALMLAMVAIPVFLIMPFESQTPRALDVAFHLKRWSPLATAVGLVATLALAAYLWRTTRWFKRAVMVLLVALAGLLAWFARQNHFEWMFHPLREPRFTPAWRTEVDPCDMVLAVVVGGEARAYPVRLLANHHVVNDVVAGRPITATY